MNINELKTIISHGENENIEFKKNFNDKAIEALVAFANYSGGKIILGVTDNKKIIGVKTGKEGIQKMINEIKQKTEYKIIPDVEVIDYDKKQIIMALRYLWWVANPVTAGRLKFSFPKTR